MADPLSVSASVAGLVSLGLQTTEYLYKYYSTYRDRDEDLAKTADRLDDLLQTLHIIDDVLRTRRWRPSDNTILQHIETSITRCQVLINELQDEVQKFQKEPSATLTQRIKGAGRRAAYPFRESTLKKLDEDVGEFRDNLSIALQALQLKGHQNTQSDIEEIKHIVKSAQAQQLAAGVRDWLKAPDATVDYNTVSAKRHAGTGRWFVQGSSFGMWLQQGNSFLWLYGFAGCGKSVLCSTAIQQAFRHQRSQMGSAVAFFFFTFNDESKQDASAALRALLLQLSNQISGLEADLTRLKDSYKHGTPPVPVLLEYLRQAVTRGRHVYILLDALDECPADTSRADVLDMIQTMRQWLLPGLHLLATSRDEPDIRDHLQPQDQKRDIEHIALKNDSVQEDIRNYVSHKVDHDPQLYRWGDHREKIKQHLTQYADGVFRWVECQLRPLRQCARSVKHLEQCLRSLPQTLDATYERMQCNISDQSREEAQRILALLCYSPRPLSVDEVIDALAVDLDILERYDGDRKLESASDLVRICPGLIEISSHSPYDRNSGSVNDDEDDTTMRNTQIVRIAHFSVQEYLVSDRIKRGLAADFTMLGSPQHAQISKTCLLYLQNDDFLRQALTPNLVQQYPLVQYAVQCWYHHYRQADGNRAQQLTKKAITLLATGNALERWIRLHNPHRTWDEGISYDDNLVRPASSTYYAALLGLDKILAGILSTSPADVNAGGGEYKSALQAASVGGHQEVVQMLLDGGADVNAQGGRYGSALQAASVGGHQEVVQMLLDEGADVNAQGGEYGSALQAASAGGYQNVAQMLLDGGADVNAQGGEHGSALRVASKCGHQEVVQMLLDECADVNAQGGRYGSALQAASVGGHQEVVQMLLDECADVNAQGGQYGSALQAASAFGHQEVVQILLDGGADVNSQDEGYRGAFYEVIYRGHHQEVVQMLLDGGGIANAPGGVYGSALQAASVGGHQEVVQMLLDGGADANAQGGDYGSALRVASAHGCQEIVQMLLDEGADVNAQGEEHGSALQAASLFGRQEVVQMLLDRGADVNAQGGQFGSALQAASARGCQKIVQMLLDGDADVNAQGAQYGGALQVASLFGRQEVVQMLLDGGADVNAQGGQRGSALQVASLLGRQEVVQMLLDEGADVNAQGGQRGSALQVASLLGRQEVVQMLLDEGANVNAQGGGFGSALQAASEGGYQEVVQILLDGGADVDAQTGMNGSALQVASKSGYQNVVQMLLDGGADVNAQEEENGSALYVASKNGYQEIVQMLLDAGADVNAQGGWYGNALQAASVGGHQEVVQMLLDGGADVNAQGGRYGSALQAASEDGCQNVVQMLLDGGADVNAQGGRYGGALQVASVFGHREVVQILLHHGALAVP